MKRSLAIVLVGVLICVDAVWLLRRSEEAHVPLESSEPPPDTPLVAREESAASVPEPPARADLAQLETLELAFEGPRARLELHIVDETNKLPVPEVFVGLWAARAVSLPGHEWEELTPRGDPLAADEGGRIALGVPAGRALAVELSGTWVRPDAKRRELAALEPEQRRTDELAVGTLDDLHFFGQVCEAGTGTPLEDVEIQLERRPAIEPMALSDARGHFELWTNSWESRKARAAKRGFMPVAFEMDGEHATESLARRLELTRAATIQGYYRECDGTPALEGSLRFWTRSGFAAHVYPREDGWFEADSLPTGEAVKVDLELEHRPIAREVASVELEPGEQRRMDWRLPARLSVRGIVLDERGAPVQGCELALYFGVAADPHCMGLDSPLDERDNATSDVEGRFAFTKAGLGDWTVALLHMGSGSAFPNSPSSWRIPVASETITVRGAEHEEVVLHCWRHLTLQGRVVDPEDRPIAYSQLSVQPAGCAASAQAWSGTDGRFKVHVPFPGTYELRVKASAWFLQSETIAARAGQEDILVKLKSEPLLRVRVVDEQSKMGLRANVFAIGAGGSTVAFSGRDPSLYSGALVAPATPDTYRIFARCFDGRCGTLEDARVEADAPGREWTVSVAPGNQVRVGSSNAAGPIEIEFSWNGIPIDHAQFRQPKKCVLTVPHGTLSARYRLRGSGGDWLTLDTPIDDADPVEIDLRFP